MQSRPNKTSAFGAQDISNISVTFRNSEHLPLSWLVSKHFLILSSVGPNLIWCVCVYLTPEKRGGINIVGVDELIVPKAYKLGPINSSTPTMLVNSSLQFCSPPKL